MRNYFRCKINLFLKILSILIPILFLLSFCGVLDHLMEKSFSKEFHYPLNGDVIIYANQVRHGLKPEVDPINIYNYTYIASPTHKCKDSSTNPDLVLIVKSALSHFEMRNAIRNTWGNERQLPNMEIRTIFNLGTKSKDVDSQKRVLSEISKYKDIIQSDFEDSYFNNTIKTMMGIRWLVEKCPQAEFFMFVDDDYFISVKNVFRFINNPFTYPQPETNDENMEEIIEKDTIKIKNLNTIKTTTGSRFYAGFAEEARPLRDKFSKWYISLQEYPWDKWPPFIHAGAFILSRETLMEMYFMSMFTAHFRFDDIFLAIVAYKLNIHIYHSEEFHVQKKPYDEPKSYENVIASHDYSDSQEMVEVWNELKKSGYA